MKKIPLTQGKFALVDDEDFERIKKIPWFAQKAKGTFYAASKGRKKIFLHRFILQAKINKQIDHLNGDGLDNRKKNLRACTNQQNRMNSKKTKKKKSSKYKGVTFDKRSRRFVAQIMKNGINFYIKSFKTEIEAAKAYNESAKKLFGRFAQLNKI